VRSKLRTSAIDGEFDAGDVRRIVRSQKSDCHRNLLGFAEAFRRDLLKERFAERQNIRSGFPGGLYRDRHGLPQVVDRDDQRGTGE